MESFRDLVESMESDFQREERAPATRPKVEPSVEENVDVDSPASGVSFGCEAPEVATEDGGRERATLALRCDMERASWARWEGGRGGGALEAREARRGQRRKTVKREHEPVTWLKATQPGFVYEALALASAGSERGPKRGRGAPEGGRSAPEAHRGRRQAEGQAEGHARLGAGPPGHPDAPHPTPGLLGGQMLSGIRRASQSTSRDIPEGVPAGNTIGHDGGLPETTLTFRCHQCQASARDASSLARHCRRHNPTRPFGCGLCPSRFNQLVHLQIHQRTHTGEKPFCCDVCGARFSRKDRLRSHQRTHTGEQPYTCPYCDACFRDTASLKAHLRTHAGEKPYACRLCKASFVNLTTFTSHWRMHSAGDLQ
ncbi:zinc finger and SCAN domain-containing protein 5B-like [Penaeus chinensis]|uniref:zinc finger and SCAN domain-containing protein 5B-like n=1 Tax=Penaeus chinensis TaxID=139456 RepID=UPI001FB72EE0|nr:zinc finger and SCAN domain-containing protein 5B-like [Penaeus chinensis]